MPDCEAKRTAIHIFAEVLSVLMLALEAEDYIAAKEAAEQMVLFNRTIVGIINMLLDMCPNEISPELRARYRELFRTT